MARNDRNQGSLGEEYERFVRDQIRVVIREELQDALRHIDLQGYEDSEDQEGYESFGNESDFDEEIRRESEEEGIPRSETRAYHRMKSRETRERRGGTQGTRGTRSSRSDQRGQVTNPESDKRLSRNREAS